MQPGHAGCYDELSAAQPQETGRRATGGQRALGQHMPAALLATGSGGKDPPGSGAGAGRGRRVRATGGAVGGARAAALGAPTVGSTSRLRSKHGGGGVRGPSGETESWSYA